MYVEIHSRSSVDEDSELAHLRDSSGKTSWVNIHPRSLEMRVERSAPQHIGKPPWHIEIQGRHSEELTSGARGADYHAIVRRLKLHLTPDDIRAVIALAQANGVLTITVGVAAADAPGAQQPATDDVLR